MKKLLFAVLCCLLVGCGTFNVQVQVQAPPGASTQPAATTFPTQIALSQPMLTSLNTPAPEAMMLRSLLMSDALNGWGVEWFGRIVKTRDGGGVWKDVSPLGTVFERQGLFVLNGGLNNEIAWAVPMHLDENNAVWRSMDGGNTWESSQPIPLGVGRYHPLGLQFPDARHGWLLLEQNGEPDRQVFLYKSENSGKSWVLANTPNTGASQAYLPANITAMFFPDGQTGWLGGWWEQNDPSQWLIFKTIDSGARWGTDDLRLPAQSGIQCARRPVDGLAPSSLAVELTCTMPKDPKYFFRRLYYLSAQTGPDWNSWRITGSFLNADFLNPSQGWMLVTSDDQAMNEIHFTNDGGKNWEKINSVEWKQVQFDFVSDKIGWAVVSNGFATGLMRTENGGRLWIQVHPFLLP